MKIIQICAAYKPAYIYGGPTMSVAKLSEELVKAGKDVLVLTTTANGKEELNVPIGQAQLVEGVPVYYFKRWTKDHTHFSPSLFWFLHQLITEEKKAGKKKQLIIHIHAWWNLVSIFSCLIAKWHGVKVVLSPRGMLTSYSLNNRNSKFKDAIHFFLGKRLLKYAHIHATSKKEKRDVLQTSKVNGITVIPNFVRFPKSFESPLPLEDNTYRLLFLSRIEQKKGLELLFKALSKISFPYQLSIAGTGEETYIKSLQALADDLGIQKNLNWLGHIANEQKFDLLAKNDLMVLTSYNENFANVVIESLAMGTPVLISEEVGLADYVEKNNFGWVVPLNPQEIANALNNSFEDTDKRTNIKLAARKNINENFNEKNLIDQYNGMYINTSKNEFL